MRILSLLAATALLAVPGALSAQGFALAGRAGSLGFGAEAAVGLGSSFALRGGVSFLPLEPSATIDDVDYTLQLPETWFNLGADLYVGGGFRIGGGVLFKSDDPSATAELASDETVEIGGQDFTGDQLGTLMGTLDSRDQAPYVLIGFGRHAAPGVGLFLDLGVAFTGEPDVSLEVEGSEYPDQEELRDRLDQEEENFREDAPPYVDYWPILNIGLKVGLGR